MGRKVNPIGFRLGIVRDWESTWFAEGEEYAHLLNQDIRIRELIHEQLGRAAISQVHIERFAKRITVTILTAKPGIVIGRRGSKVTELQAKLTELTGAKGNRLRVDVEEIEHPELDAHVVAENVVEQLERRVSTRRAMRRAVSTTMRAGAKGVKIVCKGRLSGAEMARRLWLHEGRVPLHTLRADIDYAQKGASTPFGRVGVKVWINRGEVLPGAKSSGNAQGGS